VKYSGYPNLNSHRHQDTVFSPFPSLTVFSTALSNQPSISSCCSKTANTHTLMTCQELLLIRSGKIPTHCILEFKQLIGPANECVTDHLLLQWKLLWSGLSFTSKRGWPHAEKVYTQADMYMLDLSLSLIGLLWGKVKSINVKWPLKELYWISENISLS